MTTETKVKKNLDYSASAVNLTNPLAVRDCLIAQRNRQATLAELREQAESCVPAELKKQIADLEAEIATETTGIKGYIDTFGSYQDLENGIYAVKQRKVSVSYDPKELRRCHPAEAALVIEETVNTTKINGLVKGGLLDLAKLTEEGVVKTSESYAYIIK